MTQNTNDTTTERRTILKALGGAATLGTAVGTTAASATTTKLDEICIAAPADGKNGYGYQFAVSGYLTKAGQSRDAPINDRYVSKDPHDDIDGSGQCRVHGRVEGGADCYQFAGDIVAFSIDANHPDKYDIYVNGESRDPRAMVTQKDPSDVTCSDDGQDTQQDDGEGEGFCELTNTLRVTPHKSKGGPFTVTVRVSGELELPSGERVSGTKLTVTGQGTHDSVPLSYSGVITKLSTSGTGHVSITQDEACE